MDRVEEIQEVGQTDTLLASIPCERLVNGSYAREMLEGTCRSVSPMAMVITATNAFYHQADYIPVRAYFLHDAKFYSFTILNADGGDVRLFMESLMERLLVKDAPPVITWDIRPLLYAIGADTRFLPFSNLYDARSFDNVLYGIVHQKVVCARPSMTDRRVCMELGTGDATKDAIQGKDIHLHNRHDEEAQDFDILCALYTCIRSYKAFLEQAKERANSRGDFDRLRTKEEDALEATNAFSQVAWQITHRGVEIDVEKLSETHMQIAGARSLLAKKLETHPRVLQMKKKTGKPLNVGSTKELAHLLYSEQGLALEKPDVDATCTDKVSLQRLIGGLAETSPERLLIERIVLSKELRTNEALLVSLMKLCVNDTLHPICDVFGSRTGRTYTSKPNIQGIMGKHDAIVGDLLIQSLFKIPSTHCAISLDFSQAELRVLAYLSGDKLLNEVFETGEDLHERTGKLVAEKMLQEKNVDEDVLRTLGKALNFSMLYGGGIKPIQETCLSIAGLEIDKQKASQFQSQLGEIYFGITEYRRDLLRQSRLVGYVSTLGGRGRSIATKEQYEALSEEKREHEDRVVFNTNIQGSCADILYSYANALHRVTHGYADLFCSVHDSLFFYVPKGEKERFIADCKGALQALPKGLHMGIDIKSYVGTLAEKEEISV